VPTLTAPINKSVVLTTDTNYLDWTSVAQSWGVSCPSNNNEYHVYMGTETDNLSLIDIVTKASGITKTLITNLEDRIYYWRVIASNGSSSIGSAKWRFTASADSNPW
jgi:hypothetical protein